MRYLAVGELIAEPLRTGMSRAGTSDSRQVGLTLSSVRHGPLDLTATKPIDLTLREQAKYQVRPEAFYVVRGNGRLGLVGRGALAPNAIPIQVAFPDLLIEVIPDRLLIEPRYLALVWNECTVRADIEGGARTSSGIHKINLASLRSVRIPVPPLMEQRRIVAEVEAQLKAAETGRLLIAGQRSASRQLRVRLLRDQIPLPPHGAWPWVRLDAAAEFLDGTRRPVSSIERANRIAGIPTADLTPYYGANGQAGWIDQHLFDEPLVLLAEDGGAFGSSSRPIAYRINGRAWVNNHAHVLRAVNGVNVDFLGYALSIRPDVGDRVSGSTRGKLTRSVAGGIQVPMPSPAVQAGVAEELRTRFASVDAIEAAVDDALGATGSLTAAILRRAFGNLAA